MNDEIKEFIDAYRESLDQQKDLGMQNLDNNRRLAHQNIMSGANAAGMMYSNFPERAKIQYDTGTYEPARIKLQNTYQTGLDKLRANTTGYINTLSEINEAIDKLNKQNQTPLWRQKDLDYGKYGLSAPKSSGIQGANFYDAAGNAITFATYAKKLGAKTNDDILDVAAAVSPEIYANLSRIYKAQQGTTMPNLMWNTGANRTRSRYGTRLSDEDADFMYRIGMGLSS